jgi:hypothetical protein
MSEDGVMARAGRKRPAVMIARLSVIKDRKFNSMKMILDRGESFLSRADQSDAYLISRVRFRSRGLNSFQDFSLNNGM